jgi:hypothetical protein
VGKEVVSERKKTGDELWQEAAERLLKRSVATVNSKGRCTIFYTPCPDGTVWFSKYITHGTGKDEIKMHACGSLSGKDVEKLRESHPEWFAQGRGKRKP